MLEKVLQILSISCSHRKISQPFTAAAVVNGSPSGPWQSIGAPASHYVVCLECGKKFTYDWERMRIVR
jgi:predicted transcriptional regulator